MVVTLSHCLVFVNTTNRHACPKPRIRVVFGDAAQPSGQLRAVWRAFAGVARPVSLRSGLLRGLKPALATRGGTP